MSELSSEEKAQLVRDAAADETEADPMHPQYWKGLNTGIQMCAEAARQTAARLTKAGQPHHGKAFEIFADSLDAPTTVYAK